MPDTIIVQDIERDGCLWTGKGHWDCPVSMMNECPVSLLHRKEGVAPPECPLRQGDVIVTAKGDPMVCTWTEDEDGVWRGDCDIAWEFTDGDPTKNGVTFCPRCGKRVEGET